jgi:hypothetical protein
MYKVSSLLALIGISNQQQGLKQELLTFNDNSPDALLKLILVALDFGVIEEEQRSPLWAGWTVNVSSTFQIECKAAPWSFSQELSSM